jgi:hypothetical protein
MTSTLLGWWCRLWQQWRSRRRHDHDDVDTSILLSTAAIASPVITHMSPMLASTILRRLSTFWPVTIFTETTLWGAIPFYGGFWWWPPRCTTTTASKVTATLLCVGCYTTTTPLFLIILPGLAWLPWIYVSYNLCRQLRALDSAYRRHRRMAAIVMERVAPSL